MLEMKKLVADVHNPSLTKSADKKACSASTEFKAPGPDESPFVASSGIRKCDSVPINTVLSEEWSKRAITPSDYEQLVKSGPLEHSRAIGCQVLALATIYLQTAFQRAKEVETEVTYMSDKITQIETTMKNISMSQKRLEKECAQLDAANKKLITQQQQHRDALSQFFWSPEGEAYLQRKFAKKLSDTSRDCFDQPLLRDSSHASSFAASCHDDTVIVDWETVYKSFHDVSFAASSHNDDIVDVDWEIVHEPS